MTLDSVTLSDRNISRQSPGDPLPISNWQAEQFLRTWDQDARYTEAQVRVPDPRFREAISNIRDDLDRDLASYSTRRNIEHKLADYIETVNVNAGGRFDLVKIIQSMRDCRKDAAVGLKPDGSKMFAWDKKCNLVRLCPDESRCETQRLCEKYIPAMLTWVNEKANRRIYYCVFTSPNFKPGDLLAGKKWQFEKYKKMMKGDYCENRVHGSLVVQEDPLSWRGDWNVHLNAVVCVEGEFSYKEMREAWGHNVQFDKVPANIEAMTRMLLEVVKYSAQHIGTKSEDHFQAQADLFNIKEVAPAMTDWPPELWLEWWDAQRPPGSIRAVAFRRTRSYGCLYKVKFEAPTIDISAVKWVGAIQFHGGRYHAYLKDGCDLLNSVDLIPEDNFSNIDEEPSYYGDLRGFWDGGHGPPDDQLGGII